jgi:acyl carrier protein
MHGRDEVTHKVMLHIAEVAKIDVGSIRDDMKLMGKDLSLDSLAIVGLIVRLEKEFPGKLKVDDIAEFGGYTVRRLVNQLVAS